LKKNSWSGTGLVLAWKSGWAALPSEEHFMAFFSRAENPSEDINNRFFMNKTGLRSVSVHIMNKVCTREFNHFVKKLLYMVAPKAQDRKPPLAPPPTMHVSWHNYNYTFSLLTHSLSSLCVGGRVFV
jgi:hypothetical protein